MSFFIRTKARLTDLIYYVENDKIPDNFKEEFYKDLDKLWIKTFDKIE